MDASQFTMWLQGFAELSSAPPTPDQWQSIKEHLQLVFTKVTPPVNQAVATPPPQKTPEEHAAALRKMFDRVKQAPAVPSFPGSPYIDPLKVTSIC